MNYSKSIKVLTTLLILSFTIVSCGDDPASVDEDPPEFPSFENIEPNLSYFEDNDPRKSNPSLSTDNFYQAKSYAYMLSGMSMITQSYSGIFLSTNEDEAEYKDGKWVWEYSYTYEQESVSVVIIAEETASEWLWSMTWSYDDGDGNSFEDYTVLEGNVAKDDNSGSWTFNILAEDTEQEIPLLVTNWTRTSDTKAQISTDYYENGSVTTSYDYEEDGSQYSLSMTSDEIENNILVFWDTETMTGYYQSGSDSGNRNCWDENFQDINCDDVGY